MAHQYLTTSLPLMPQRNADYEPLHRYTELGGLLQAVVIAKGRDGYDSENPTHPEVDYSGRDCLPRAVVDRPESGGFIEEPLWSEMLNLLQDLTIAQIDSDVVGKVAQEYVLHPPVHTFWGVEKMDDRCYHEIEAVDIHLRSR